MTDVPRRVKLHRRDVTLDGRVFTVLSPRPSEPLRIATNHAHETWHILSNPTSARFVAWLMLHVSRERHPNTIAVIDQRFLVPNPFDGDASDPIVIMNSNLGTPGRRGLAALSGRLPLGRSEGTVRLNVGSIDDAWDTNWSLRPAHQRRCRIDSVKGMTVIAAPGPTLCWLALAGLRFWADEFSYGGSSSNYMDDRWYTQPWIGFGPWTERAGEFQVFLDFDERVRAATARRNKLFPGDSRTKLTPDERELVWRK